MVMMGSETGSCMKVVQQSFKRLWILGNSRKWVGENGRDEAAVGENGSENG